MITHGITATLLTGALASVVLILSANSAHSQTASQTKEPRQFRVLDSQEVILGPRSIIYNRVETPVLKPQPAPVEKSTTPAAEYVPTAAELEEMSRWEAMNHVSLFLSGTVYDNQLTEVRFRQEETDVVFWSTVNFSYLSQLIDFQTKDTNYSLFMGSGDSTREEFDRQNAEFQQMGRQDLVSSWPSDLQKVYLSSSPASTWRITSKDPVSAEVRRTIEDIHAFFDANRATLITQHVEREAARIAHEQWLKENPPQPKDTVIQFFPIQSDHSPTEARVIESSVSTTREK